MSANPTFERCESVVGGIGLRVVSVGCYSLMAALLKMASARGVVASEMLFYRSLFGLPLVLIWALTSHSMSALGTRRPLAHIGRCALGIASVLCTFQALIMLPLADATTIGFTAPAFATILSWLILSERVGRQRWLAVVVGFAGVVIIMRPGAVSEVPIEGVGVALLSALGMAGVVITLRQLRHTEHVAAIVFWLFASSAVVGALFLPFFGRVHDEGTMLTLAGAGIAGALMQITLTASLQRAPVSVLAPFDYLQIVGALVLGWLLFAEEPTVNTFVGAALIVSSGMYIAWREHRLRVQA